MMKIRLTLFVGICFLGMVIALIGCSPSPPPPLPPSPSLPSVIRLGVGEKLPNWHYDENNFGRLIDLSRAAVFDKRVIIDGQLIEGTITIGFNKGQWIAYNGTKFTCVAPGGCNVDALSGGTIIKGVIEYYNK